MSRCCAGHHGPPGPPKEMAPAGKQGAISNMIFDNAQSYRPPRRIATAEALHG